MNEAEWQTRKTRIDTRLRSLNPVWQIIPWREGLDLSCNSGKRMTVDISRLNDIRGLVTGLRESVLDESEPSDSAGSGCMGGSNELPKLTESERRSVLDSLLTLTQQQSQLNEPATEYRAVDLRERGIGETQAADLRARLKTFAEDWNRPEAAIYDENPAR